MNSSKLLFILVTIFILSESCTSHKGYFAVSYHNQIVKSKTKVKAEPVTVVCVPTEDSNNQLSVETQTTAEKSPIIREEIPVNEPILTASNTEVLALENAVKATKYEEKINTALRNAEQPNAEQKAVKMNFAQKIIVKKIQKKMAKNNNLVGFNDWNSFLKIGVILLGIGIVLAIFGLGAIGGLSALIGLIFAILGLLQQV